MGSWGDPISVLFVEDDARLAAAVRRSFRTYDVDVQVAKCAADALEALRTREFDALLLDLVLPDSQGTALCRTLRETGVLSPILIYTGTATGDLEIQRGLAAGADEYLVKPVKTKTLHARVRALVRAHRRTGMILKAGGATLDRDRSLLVYADGTSTELMPKECHVLGYLILHRGEIVSREALLRRYWQDAPEQTRAVDNVIARLRKLVKRAGLSIEAVRSEGYRLAESA